MKLADLILALTRFNAAHPDCTGCHVWRNKETGAFIAKKAFSADTMMDCIMPTGEQYVGLMPKKELPCSAKAAERWLSERMGQKAASKPTAQPANPTKSKRPELQRKPKR